MSDDDRDTHLDDKTIDDEHLIFFLRIFSLCAVFWNIDPTHSCHGLEMWYYVTYNGYLIWSVKYVLTM